jgi:hypothetical protein
MPAERIGMRAASTSTLPSTVTEVQPGIRKARTSWRVKAARPGSGARRSGATVKLLRGPCAAASTRQQELLHPAVQKLGDG